MGPKIKTSVHRLDASCRKVAAGLLATGFLVLMSAPALAATAPPPVNPTPPSVVVNCGDSTISFPVPPSGTSVPKVNCSTGSASTNSTNSLLIGVAVGALAMFGIQWFRRRRGVGAGNDQTKLLNSGGRDFKSLLLRPDTRFADVAGCDEAKAELEDLVEIMKDPSFHKALGADPPKGVLLYGGPGNGKTLLAKAVAGELGVPFFSVNGSEFVQMFVGVGAARVRDLFDQAKKNKPAIIFIDEFDALGKTRADGKGMSHDERDQTLNQILTEMDGFSTDTGVIVIAATNRVDILDPAIIRKGRFDWHIKIDKADVRGRRAILEVHTKKVPLADDVDLDALARQTPGLSGADLAALVQEAARLRARIYRLESKQANNGNLYRPDETPKVRKVDFAEALMRVAMGPDRKSLILTEADKLRCARHELGHAVAGHVLDETRDVATITLIPRGQSLGSAWFVDREDRQLITREELINRAAVALGGLVAEKMYYTDTNASSGPSGDLESVTSMMRQAICLFGMGTKEFHEKYGYRVFSPQEAFMGPTYSSETGQEVDLEVGKLLNEAEKRCSSILRKHRKEMEDACAILMTPGQETMTGAEFAAIIEREADSPEGPRQLAA